MVVLDRSSIPLTPIGTVRVLRDVVAVLNFVVSEGTFPDVADPLNALTAACEQVDQAASGSWIGYHARTYYRGFEPPPPSAFFSPEWGLGRSPENTTVGEWIERTEDEVMHAISLLAGDPDLEPARAYARQATDAFNDAKSTLTSVLTAELDDRDDPRLRAALAEIEAAEPTTGDDPIGRRQPPRVPSHDTEATRDGTVVPPHIALLARLEAMREPAAQCMWLATEVGEIATYIEERAGAAARNRIFIGHCGSPMWRELQAYLVEVLGLKEPWFDRVPADGADATRRLWGMLDGVDAAFVVVTLSDERDGLARVVRENVVHEIGLFGGRLGANRAFILVEEGCEGFDDVIGISQIRFPAGRLEAVFADVRRVLQRAAIL
jgi:hypothetical protein